jgi:pimeloyl-ACP methyl ester carboxylesterase
MPRAGNAVPRVCILGGGGSGKSTLTAVLGERLGCPIVHLDDLYDCVAGTVARDSAVRLRWEAAICEVACGERWVAEGNFPGWIEELAGRADLVVWLDVPFRVAGLVLVATPTGLRPLYADSRSRNSALHPHWQAELALHPPPAAPRGDGALRVARLRDGLWMALEGDRPLTPLPIPDVPAELAARLETVLAFDALPWLGEVRTSVLIVCGAEDDVVPLDHCEALRAALPDAELVVFERSAHAPMVTEAAAFRAAVERFLARLRI